MGILELDHLGSQVSEVDAAEGARTELLHGKDPHIRKRWGPVHRLTSYIPSR